MGTLSSPGLLYTNFGVGVFVIVGVGGSGVMDAVLVGSIVWVAVGGADVGVVSSGDVTVIVASELP